jgi:copper resistance protein C
MNARRLFVAAYVALAAAGAHAHVFLDHSDPRVGSQVPSTPVEVRLWFSEPLEGAFTSVTVTDASGRRVDRGDAQLDPSDKTLLHVSLQALAPGAYAVHWRAVSVDTHVTQGDFIFRVGA